MRLRFVPPCVTVASAALILLASGCGRTAPVRAPTPLDILADWMTGRFSSAAQAHSEDGYYPIDLAMARIWRDRGDGLWLYVEQSLADAKAPYRQRVYRLVHIGGSVFESEVYLLPGDPLVHAGAYRATHPLADLDPTDLTEKPGCGVILRRMADGSFAGSTLGSQCASRLAGADHATSYVRITRDRLVSWDRGFDREHKQVWGATKGGYVFDKVANFRP